jgi:hypothetical protein
MNLEAKNLELPVLIRPATEADVAFIFNSWLKSYRNTMQAVLNPVYFEFQHKAIENLLKKCQVQVACSSTNNTELYAYLVYEQIEGINVLHYAYTKHTYRRLGLQKKLAVELKLQNGGFYTHATPTGKKIIAEKGYKFVYNPYLGYGII